MRDPRTDPRPGDVLRKSKRERRIESIYTSAHVCDRRLRVPTVTYVAHVGAPVQSCWLTTLIRWARDAEVLHVAQTEETE